MGIVQKQSIRIALITYLGVLIGALNTMFLFPRVLGAEKHGLVMLLLSIATVFSQFVHLGVPHIILRFYPYFSKKRKYIQRIAFQVPFFTLIFFGLFIFIFGDTLFYSYSLKSSLFASYSNYIFPLVVSFVLFEVLVSISRSEFRTIFPSFLREFLIRLFTFLLLVFSFVKFIGFEQFMLLWIGFYTLNVVFMVIYLLSKGFVNFDFGFQLIDDQVLGKEMIRYGIVTLLTTSATILVNRIDILILGYFLKLENIAFYTIALFMATLIQIPARSIIQIGKPLLAKAWERGDLNEIKLLYHKTALNQLIIGSFIFVAIWLNIDDLLVYIPKKYQGIEYVFFFIGLAKLFDVSCGINGAVLVTSKKYRYDLFINLLLIGLTIITNVIFIPIYGIEGAALATAISVVIYNFVKWYFLKRWFGFQPFNYRFLLAILVCLITSFLTLIIPFNFEIVSIRLFIKSFFIFFVFSFLILSMKVSPEINELVNKYFKRR